MGRRIDTWVWVWSLAVVFGLAAGTTYPGDVVALLAVKQRFVDESKSLSSWSGDDPCGERWTGVYCLEADYPASVEARDNFSHVTELRLLQLGLQGQLAPEIGGLSALKYLNVMRNRISGSIPSTVGQLKNLQFLGLSENEMTGTLPREMGFMPTLIMLRCDSNEFSGAIPDTFLGSNLPKLEHVSLTNNSLNGSIPSGLASLSSLRRLLLDRNRFSGSLPPEIGGMSGLETLQLDYNKFDSGTEIPAEFAAMSGLMILSLRSCGLGGSIPDLSRSTRLAVLDLSRNELVGSIFDAGLYSSVNLTSLDLSYNHVDGIIPDYLSALPSLTFFSCRRNNISGLVPSGLVAGRPSSAIFDLQTNLLTGIANGSDSLALQRQEGGGTSSGLWLYGTPFCKDLSQQRNDRLCTPRNLTAALGVGVPTQVPVSEPSSCSALKCSSGSVVLAASGSNCRCAVPASVTGRLESPSFDVFDPYVGEFDAYLASGLNLAAEQVRTVGYMYQAGPRFLFSALVFPSGEVFSEDEVANIYDVLARQEIRISDRFGPYDLVSFATPAKTAGSERKKGSGLSSVAIAGIVVGAVAFVVLKTLCMYAVLRAWISSRSPRVSDHAKGSSPGKGGMAPAAVLGRRQSGGNGGHGGTMGRSESRVKVAGVTDFSFEEIARMTENFSENRLVGEGGYGKVYRGETDDGRRVAVKVREGGSHQGVREFETEIQLLSRVHHRNLVGLVGYCGDGGEQILVYEFIAYGSLQYHLSASSRVPLSFLTRLQIALGSARGIHYLHTLADPPIYHRDVKASNILLDELFEAKVSDFGLSKLAPRADLGGATGYVSTVVKGTPGYLDPEYFKTHRLTDKSDVYSLGVVILVMVTGMQPITDGKNLVREVDAAYMAGRMGGMVDFRMRGTYPGRAMHSLTGLALLCCRDVPEQRPTIGEVVTELEQLWRETYSDAGDDTDSLGTTSSVFSTDLLQDFSRSRDSFIEIEPSILSSTVWTNSGNGGGSNHEPGSINIVNPR